MDYIDEKVSELDTERKALQEQIIAADVTDEEGSSRKITNHLKTWETVSFEDKQTIVDTLIKGIKFANGSIEITWNI